MRTVLTFTGIAGWIFACASAVSAAEPPADAANELPRSWKLEEIAKQTPPLVPAGRVYPLAWSIIEDERPVRVESCLVVKIAADGRYCFAHLYRRPDQPEAGWQVGMTHIADDKPETRPGRWVHHTKQFAARPTNRELYAALKMEELNWKFDLENSWRFVGCGVCERNWEAALGEKPTRFFGK